MQKILILGSGGREHAFAWKLKQSNLCKSIFIAPGNAGTAQIGTNVALDVCDFKGIRSFLLSNDIAMLVVGPEVPLVEGIYDFIKGSEELKHIVVIGPSAEGAQLEGSKAFAKEFMIENNIPTAAYLEVTNENLEAGLERIDASDVPIVLKADGLAAGKGVLILNDRKEAKNALKDMLGGKFGQAGARVVIEDFLDGMEFSVFVLTDGHHYKILPIAKDYKRIGEGDVGLNTGGMGAVSPVSFVDDALMQKVENQIIIPTISGIKKRGIIYNGFVFFGLIVVKGNPYVIEYNCRMGDPETEAVLPRLESDLLSLFLALEKGALKEQKIEISSDFAATTVLVSGGYPEAYEKGFAVNNLEEGNNCLIFHAGTKESENGILTNGGRVFAVTGMGSNQDAALKVSQAVAAKVTFEKKYYRRDIGFDL